MITLCIINITYNYDNVFVIITLFYIRHFEIQDGGICL